MVLGLPLLGDLVEEHSRSPLARTLGILLASGVPILAALRIARETADNTVVAQALARAEERVEGGEPLSAPLVAAHLFPPLVTGLIEVGGVGRPAGDVWAHCRSIRSGSRSGGGNDHGAA